MDRTRFGGAFGARDAVSEGASSRPRLSGRTNQTFALSFGAAVSMRFVLRVSGFALILTGAAPSVRL